MKIFVFGALALAISLGSAVSAACPVGNEDGRRPVVQNVALQASEMIERAQTLEASALDHDRSAASFERTAETLANRARILRNQAQLVALTDRNGVLEVADELAQRSAIERARASEERVRAADLRAQARILRERAVQLVRLQNGGRGGWNGRRAVDTAI